MARKKGWEEMLPDLPTYYPQNLTSKVTYLRYSHIYIRDPKIPNITSTSNTRKKRKKTMNQIPLRPATTTTTTTSMYHHPKGDLAYQGFTRNSQGLRINTDVVIVEALRKQYPELHLTVVPEWNCSVLGFIVSSGDARADPFEADDALWQSLKWRCYLPAERRQDESPGVLYDQVKFGRYGVTWQDRKYILYVVNDGAEDYEMDMNYVLGSSQEATEGLVLAAAKYANELHDQVYVFDGGSWGKSHALWKSVQDSHWENVILEPARKKAIISVIDTFFNSREKYHNLKVPWKRGIIYYGPPGNGKTISIKAMMHSLYRRADPIPTLYVRSLASWSGPESSINMIFSKARQMAPCFLVFEDLDSIITDAVRSYFLNEVDGLESNDGILMLGSTNHLDKLDPGIAKRPSRFDRKYLFPNPSLEERVQYSEFWRRKLADNESIEFPEKLNRAIASITEDFSFAYMQEAFVAALLAIAGAEDDNDPEKEGAEEPSEDQEDLILVCKEDDLNRYLLWRQMKIQIELLRAELGDESKISVDSK